MRKCLLQPVNRSVTCIYPEEGHGCHHGEEKEMLFLKRVGAELQPRIHGIQKLNLFHIFFFPILSYSPGFFSLSFSYFWECVSFALHRHHHSRIIIITISTAITAAVIYWALHQHTLTVCITSWNFPGGDMIDPLKGTLGLTRQSSLPKARSPSQEAAELSVKTSLSA